MLNSTLAYPSRINSASSRMNYRILLVGAYTESRARLQQFLAEEISIKATEDPGEGIALTCSGLYDIILLDTTLQGLDGFEMLRLIRSRCDIPVMMMMSGAALGDRITALQMGADDCVTANCHFQELFARIQAILRRYTSAGTANRYIEIGAVRIDPGSRNVWINGVPVVLTAAQYIILETLMRTPGRVVTRERLSWTLRQRESSGLDRSLDVHVAHLRRKLGRPSPILTVRGEGYFFCYEPLEQRDES